MGRPLGLSPGEGARAFPGVLFPLWERPPTAAAPVDPELKATCKSNKMKAPG